MTYFFGVDLGTLKDYTALSVLRRVDKIEPSLAARRQENDKGRIVSLYHLVHLERLPLGLTYPLIADRITEVYKTPDLTGDCALVVDATGVGLPVVHMLRERRLNPVAVSLTAGSAVTARDSGYTVPKRDVVTALQLLFQSRRLKIAKGLQLAETFVQELLEFKVKVNERAKETFEAAREGVHDDIVLSVALAAWYAERQGSPLAALKKQTGYDDYDVLNWGMK